MNCMDSLAMGGVEWIFYNSDLGCGMVDLCR